MARRKQIGRRVEGWKAKSWYKVYAPDSFEKTYIGDTISGNPENVMGRVMQTTLGEMTQDYSKQSIKMRFRINNVAGDAAYTEFVGHEVTRDYLRALVKRRTSRIDSIVLATTNDGKKVRLTITCLTLSRANISQVHAIRKLITDQLVQTASKMDFESFVKEIVSGDAARELFKNIKLIYPVRRVDIIKSRLEEAAVLTPITA
ncbi:MAG: 30S ribosomal protein S3ae [Methanomicrobiales archaeon]|nr:30S ribosomal protein S3ae [Methanomicrobiales archaeon]